MFSQQTAELFSVACITHRFVQSPARHTAGSRTHAGPKHVKGAHGEQEPITFSAHHVFGWHPTIAEFNLANRMCRDHGNAFNYCDARHPRANYECRQSCATVLFRTSPGKDCVEVCHPG